MLIGEFLEEKMKAKHMTKAELSRLSGVPATTIGSMISRNNTRVAIETLLKICEVLECDINEYIATIRSTNAKPRTEMQARLAELAEAGNPSDTTRILMGLPEKQKSPRISFDTREEAIKYFRSLPEADFEQLEVFAEYLTYRRTRLPE